MTLLDVAHLGCTAGLMIDCIGVGALRVYRHKGALSALRALAAVERPVRTHRDVVPVARAADDRRGAPLCVAVVVEVQ
jgi:hypothetical protein